jgi:hypothetical protein
MRCCALCSRRGGFLAAVVALGLLGSVATAEGASITIEPDDYPVDTALTHGSPHVTLMTLGSDNVAIPLFTVTVAKGDSATTDLSPTGDMVFAHAGVSFFTINRKLRAEFNGTTSDVSIAFAGGIPFSTTTARLEVYDVSGNLLETDVSDPTGYGVFGTLSVSRPQADIARAVIYGGFGEFGSFDALSFATPVPEPAGIGICAAVAGGLLLRRRGR